jgi:hypothetical protein
MNQFHEMRYLRGRATQTEQNSFGLFTEDHQLTTAAHFDSRKAKEHLERQAS